ncbi:MULTISPECIES: rod shape-determining protein MreC [Globicatella]|uniref:Cell shape-determining protein MreC n=2 Tax=Globicatella sulfidifaciens TaxID=136093 RepID=A0A1T4JYH5_9LACT|nr:MULTISPECIES: rod shape-determining protein MreC [Globicatella]NLJ17280.1 rod shape-determining protein MreC [Globicatella sulfidifaciens]OFK62994.1 rod shape-determining protein MreC [Globicatella sp. HMSC072A10]WPC08694.1 rod shape-determining protein MreC [Globicatella sp. PHS-GS-PNBC-21-1553]SJZ35231.1 rod shape-determining protein MreC [Globicatella sulfidifaciens DSM 15739]
MNNKKLIGILLSTIMMVSLIAYTMTKGTNNIFTSAINDTASWTGRVFSEPVNVVVKFVNSVDKVINTFEENQQLKSKIDQVYELQVRVADLEAENEAMRKELKLNESLGGFTVQNATVIARNPDQWMETLTIDVGSSQGVKENMAVMAGNGLVGRIIEVNANSSKVLLLTSEKSNAGMVSANIQSKSGSANGIVSSYDRKTKRYIMTQVDPEAEVKEGDMVITSGLGGIIPRTLLIGEVANVRMDDYGLFQTVEIVPAGEMTDIRFVTVIMREGQSDVSEN